MAAIWISRPAALSLRLVRVLMLASTLLFCAEMASRCAAISDFSSTTSPWDTGSSTSSWACSCFCSGSSADCMVVTSVMNDWIRSCNVIIWVTLLAWETCCLIRSRRSCRPCKSLWDTATVVSPDREGALPVRSAANSVAPLGTSRVNRRKNTDRNALPMAWPTRC
ncbi:hypothetical protein D3C73_1068460 [compost metagenome]